MWNALRPRGRSALHTERAGRRVVCRLILFSKRMNAETQPSAIGRLQSITTEVDSLRRSIDEQELSASDRQYLSRCFELLQMELEALQEYLAGLR